MNNLSSYCGLVDAKIRASDKDLPVGNLFGNHLHTFLTSSLQVEQVWSILTRKSMETFAVQIEKKKVFVC